MWITKSGTECGISASGARGVESFSIQQEVTLSTKRKIMKKERHDDSSSKKNLWGAFHWLGDLVLIGTEKSIKKFCKANSFSEKHPLYHAIPLNKKNITVGKCDKCDGRGYVSTIEGHGLKRIEFKIVL